MKISRIVPVALVAGVAFAAGMAATAALARADARAPRAGVGLGSAAAQVLAAEGHPVKISYSSDTQVWFYRGASGAVAPRYEVNQGLVVRVRGG